MLTLLIIFLVLAAMCGVAWWFEEGPARFVMPEPIFPPVPKRYVSHTKAGYKPSRKLWRSLP